MTALRQSAKRDASDSSADRVPRHPATSSRALLVGFVLAMGHVLWLVALEQYWSRSFPSRIALVSTVLFIFFWLVVLNAVVRRRRPHQALSTGELLTVFSMISVGGALAGTDMVPVLVHLLMEGTHADDEVSKYAVRVLPHVATWVRVTDPEIVNAYFIGHTSLFANGHSRAFVGPFLWWALCIACFLLMCGGASAVLRLQWSRNEHLSYPVIQLPLAMASQKAAGLFSNRLFWVGFGLAGGLTLLDGLHFLFPAVPSLPTKGLSSMQTWLPSPVWAAMGLTPINLYPFAIGMAFAIPLDLLFSFWFFTWVWKFERIIGTAYGITVSPWPVNPGWPHYGAQMIGVWVTLLAVSLWTARRHLRGVLRQALRPGAGAEDRGEAIRYRTALISLIVGFVGMLAFFLSLGITAAMVIPYMVLLLGICVIAARIRTELGPPINDLMGAGPDRAIFTFASPLVVGPRSWITFSTMTFWLHREAYTTYPIGHHADALKMAEIGGGLNRRFWIALFVVGLAGGLLAFWWTLYLGFIKGPTRGNGWNFLANCYSFCIWRSVGGTFEDATPRPNWGEVIAMLIGAGLTLGLSFVRGMGINLPLHPIAYLLTAGVALSHFWFAIFVAWGTKLIVLRYGGLALYRRALPLFFGMILGQFIIGIGWMLLGIVLDIETWGFWTSY